MGGHALTELKTCTKCRRKKSLHLFSIDRKSPDGLNYNCRACCRKAVKKSFEETSQAVLSFMGALKSKKAKQAFARFVRDEMPAISLRWEVDAELVEHLEET